MWVFLCLNDKLCYNIRGGGWGVGGWGGGGGWGLEEREGGGGGG